MENQQSASAKRPGAALQARIHSLASPKFVLTTIGLSGLLVDLFIRPISGVGLALILLASAPWILQAWSQGSRSQPATGSRGAAAPVNAQQVTTRRPAPDHKPHRAEPPARDPAAGQRRPGTREQPGQNERARHAAGAAASS